MINIEINIPVNLLNKLETLEHFGTELQRLRARSIARMYNRSQESHDPSKGGTPHSEGRYGPEGYPGGNLMRSAVPEPKTGEFGYTVEYAPYVEFGHRTRSGGFVEGQNYLHTNVETEKPELQEEIVEALENA